MTGARAWIFLGVLVGLSLLVAGCGGGSRSPSVASLRTTTPNGASGSGAGRLAFAPPPGGAGIGTSISTTVGTAAGDRYAACMRAHGVPSFPGPDSTGTITITVSTSLDPGAPAFQQAEAACQHLLPAGRGPSTAMQERIEKTALAFASCMRAHGAPGYPDPTFSGGGVRQGFGPKDGIDPSSPAFQAAEKACRTQRSATG
jgi:hypothetical protein